MAIENITPDIRFWERVRKTDSCWLWTGSKDNCGYGTLTRRDKQHRAHRYAYQLTNGPIENGLCVLHKCDNPPCVNPDHLVLGSQQDNIKDMIKKQRHVYAVGSRHINAKLTESDVREILRLHSIGLSHPTIAARYGVTYGTISKITLGNSWKHVSRL